MKDESKIVVAGRHPENYEGAVNPPVYHASTIVSRTLGEWEDSRRRREAGERGTFYGRSGTPTSFALEDFVTELEGGHRARLFPSGIAAIATVLTAYLNAGDHILVADNVYGPCRRLCQRFLTRFGVTHSFFDPLRPEAVEALFQPNTKALYLEAPGSLTFEMMDVPRLAALGRAKEATVMMDNTWASPLFFKPFQHGIDVSIHAATKYLVGHSDAMLGIASSSEAAWPLLAECTTDLGQCAGPDDVYLGQRGARTLAVRLQRHGENALALAEWFWSRPEVECVMYPGHPRDPGHQIWQRDFLGASGLFGVTLKPLSKQALTAFVDRLRFFHLGASWGGYESLIMVTHPNDMRSVTAWPHPGPTLRFHAGLEAVEDLILDLEAGFQQMRAAA